MRCTVRGGHRGPCDRACTFTDWGGNRHGPHRWAVASFWAVFNKKETAPNCDHRHLHAPIVPVDPQPWMRVDY